MSTHNSVTNEGCSTQVGGMEQTTNKNSRRQHQTQKRTRSRTGRLAAEATEEEEACPFLCPDGWEEAAAEEEELGA